MNDLVLQFADGQIQGSGNDIIGPFTFAGTMSESGLVTMVKQYIGRHRVHYIGTYDGEGVMQGEWAVGVFHGPWMIKIRREGNTHLGEIKEYVPNR